MGNTIKQTGDYLIQIVYIDIDTDETKKNSTILFNTFGNIANIHAFQNNSLFKAFLKKLDPNKKIILISTGSLGKILIKDINHSSDILFMNIFCMRVSQHREWAYEFKKIKLVEDNFGNIVNFIKLQLDFYGKINTPPFRLAGFPLEFEYNFTRMLVETKYSDFLLKNNGFYEIKSNVYETASDIVSFFISKFSEMNMNEDQMREENAKIDLLVNNLINCKDVMRNLFFNFNSSFYEILNNIGKKFDFLDVFKLRYIIFSMKNINPNIGGENRKKFPEFLYRGGQVSEKELNFLFKMINKPLLIKSFLIVTDDKAEIFNSNIIFHFKIKEDDGEYFQEIKQNSFSKEYFLINMNTFIKIESIEKLELKNQLTTYLVKCHFVDFNFFFAGLSNKEQEMSNKIDLILRKNNVISNANSSSSFLNSYTNSPAYLACNLAEMLNFLNINNKALQLLNGYPKNIYALIQKSKILKSNSNNEKLEILLKAEKLIEIDVQVENESAFPEIQMYILESLAKIKLSKKEYTIALEYYNKLDFLIENIKNKLSCKNLKLIEKKINILLKQGIIYKNIGEKNKSLKIFNKALEFANDISHEHKNNNHHIKIYLSIANLYESEGDLDKSLEYCIKANNLINLQF